MVNHPNGSKQVLRPHDRVELASLGCTGTVERADAQHVRVKWDDGKVGLLYWDAGMLPNANHLIRLTGER
jgi:hypothetical protein